MIIAPLSAVCRICKSSMGPPHQCGGRWTARFVCGDYRKQISVSAIIKKTVILSYLTGPTEILKSHHHVQDHVSALALFFPQACAGIHSSSHTPEQ